MVSTAIGGDQVEPLVTGCWCCEDRTVQASLLRLDEHAEVGVCFRCVDWLHKRKRKLQRRTQHAPAGPRWRRLQYRAGLGDC